MDSPDITILVTAFERPEALRRLLLSIEKYAPELPVVVVDTSASVADMPIRPDVMKYIKLPFDAGVSAARNYGVRQVRTKYVFLCEEDCEFTDRTDLLRASRLLQRSDVQVLGIQASGVDYSGTFAIEDGNVVRFKRDHYAAIPLPPDGTVLRYDFVPNIFLAEQSALAMYRWDERYKTGEHFAYFYHHCPMLRVGFTPDVAITHGFPGKPSTVYKQHRLRAVEYVQDFLRRSNLRSRIDLTGHAISI